MFVDKKANDFKNKYFIKYDFYQMTAEICNKRKNNMINIDRETIIDAIKFFIIYEINLKEINQKIILIHLIAIKFLKKMM